MEAFNFEIKQGGWIRQCECKPSEQNNQDGLHEYYSIYINFRFFAHLIYENNSWKAMDGILQSDLIEPIGEMIRIYVQ